VHVGPVSSLANILYTVTPKQQSAVGMLLEKFKTYAPDFKGPDSPPESVKAVLSVVEKCSIDNGDGGAYLSHFGNRQWV
jgi:hypothetical protein